MTSQRQQTTTFFYVLVALTLVFTAIRMYMASVFPLADDESFYWLWAQHPAACYFDHPYMVALLPLISTKLLGDTTFAFRLPTILLTVANTWLIWVLAKKLFGTKAAYVSTLYYIVAPLFALGGFLVASDTPLGFFWLLSMLALYKAVFEEKRNYYLIAGVTIGLALSSKFTGILLVISVLLLLLSSKHFRLEFKRPYVYLCGVIAFMVFFPVFWWNYQNDWASFLFNLTGRHKGASIAKFKLPELLGAEFLFLSPLIFTALTSALYRAYRLKFTNPPMRFLWYFSAPALAVFWGASLITRILPHWPAMGYIGLLIASGALATGCAGRRAPAGLITITALVGIVFTSLMHVQAFYRLLPLDPGDDNTNHLYGWDKVTPVVQKQLTKLGGRDKAYLFSDRYQFGAQLAYNLKMSDRTFSLNPAVDQFDYWMKGKDLRGSDGVLVWEEDWGLKEEVPAAFERTMEVAVVPIYRNGELVRTFHVVACYNLKQVPK